MPLLNWTDKGTQTCGICMHSQLMCDLQWSMWQTLQIAAATTNVTCMEVDFRFCLATTLMHQSSAGVLILQQPVTGFRQLLALLGLFPWTWKDIMMNAKEKSNISDKLSCFHVCDSLLVLRIFHSFSGNHRNIHLIYIKIIHLKRIFYAIFQSTMYAK